MTCSLSGATSTVTTRPPGPDVSSVANCEPVSERGMKCPFLTA